MSSQMNFRVPKLIAELTAGFNIFVGVIGFTLVIVFLPDSVGFDVILWFVLSIVYSVLGVMILSRAPQHTIGWLFLLMGFLSSLGWLYPFAQVFDFSQKFLELGERVREVVFIPVVTIPLTLVLQFFPDGHLPSKRWWPVTAASLVGMLGLTAYFAFSPWVPGPGGSPIQNPFGLEGQEQLFNLIDQISQIIMLMGVIGSLVMVIARFWKSGGIQRVQMKWLILTVILGIPIQILLSSTIYNYYLLFLLPVLMAVAMSLAILRYRLFDIDLIIRRTLQYGLLTGTLALVYYGSVLLLQSLVERFTGEQSPVVIVVSTLGIAALFNPLRTRIQDFIDRRFYRKKYDAERALAEFAATTRDEVELERLSTTLLSVVEDTVQPRNISLWIAGKEKETPTRNHVVMEPPP